MNDCQISESKKNWRELYELLEKYRNSFFGRKTYERLLNHYHSRIKNTKKITEILKPLYSDALNARYEVEEYKKKFNEYLGIYNSKFDKRIKTMNAILNGVSLKHFLLDCESEYNERPY